MKKVALYARYSSDLQTDASIEDQIRTCTAYAEREGWKVCETYTDHGISGASLMRPGIQMLMQDAAMGKFDIVVTEGLDRLSRDQADIAGLYKRLQFAAVPIFTLSDGGEVSDIHIGLKGTMNALFLKDLALKTHRGLSGRVEKGKSGGGICYGYKVLKDFDANGELVRGEREVVPEQAIVVNRIFTEYAAGIPPRKIAKALNDENIPCPSGKEWGSSTIYGNRRRGTGIINNDLYIGRLVWNRQKFLKDPDTGKRVARLNPEEKWQITDVPHLRIIDQALWDKVKAKQKVLDKQENFWNKQRPRNLFSFLLKCGCCNGGMSIVSSGRYGCSTSRNKGTCENRLTIKQENLEHTILDAMQNHFMQPELIKVFCEEYTRFMNELSRSKNAELARYKAELKKLATSKDSLIEALTNGIPASEVKEPLDKIIKRREEIEKFLEGRQEEQVILHPNMASRYYKEVMALRTSLNRDDGKVEAADLLRSLIDKIVLTPKASGKEYAIDLHGDLAGILTIATGKNQVESNMNPLVEQVNEMSNLGHRNFAQESPEKGDEIEKTIEFNMPESGFDSAFARSSHLYANICKDKMVAGAGFEPTTFGL
tara:strand:+ start:22271 stop:24064 length:1794 start_codon:yes stop_codon:yes gene_type:complete